MIGSEGPVLSVLAVGRGDPASWKLVHPDSHSRTSNVLVRVLLERRYGTRPELGAPVPMEGWSPPPTFPEGEAFVLIGTRALRWRELRNEPSLTVLDMGEVWTQWTGLPFVFAVWTARRGVILGEWPARFEALKRENMARLREIVEAWPGLEAERLTVDEAVEYLTRNIRFDLNDRAMAGFRRFYEEGRDLGLFPAGWSLERSLARD
jgi:chorismate dehydratase